jgi:hypothetical protein
MLSAQIAWFQSGKEMTNYTDLTVVSLENIGGAGLAAPYSEAITTATAITLKDGIVTINNAGSGALAVTIADPTATTDDNKRLRILSTSADAHTLVPATPFGNGGAGVAKATFGGAAGDSLSLVAYNGYWYVVNANNVTLGAA